MARLTGHQAWTMKMMSTISISLPEGAPSVSPFSTIAQNGRVTQTETVPAGSQTFTKLEGKRDHEFHSRRKLKSIQVVAPVG